MCELLQLQFAFAHAIEESLLDFIALCNQGKE